MTLDLAIWMANVGISSGATFQMGDANRDGVVDGLDLDLWRATAGAWSIPNGQVPVEGAGHAVPAARSSDSDSQAIPCRQSRPKRRLRAPTSGTPASNVAPPATTVAMTAAVSVALASNPAAKAPQVADPMPLTAVSTICVGVGQGIPNPQSTLVGSSRRAHRAEQNAEHPGRPTEAGFDGG